MKSTYERLHLPVPSSLWDAAALVSLLCSSARAFSRHFCSLEGVSTGRLGTTFNSPRHADLTPVTHMAPEHSATASQINCGGSLSLLTALKSPWGDTVDVSLIAALPLVHCLVHYGCLMYAVHMEPHIHLYKEHLRGWKFCHSPRW